MALITCPECNGQVSDKAATCPHCGCPITASVENQNAYCVISNGMPGKISWIDKNYAIDLTMELTGAEIIAASKLLETPGSIIKDKLTKRDATIIELNYKRFNFPVEVRQSHYSLADAEQQNADERLRRAAEDHEKHTRRMEQRMNEAFTLRKMYSDEYSVECSSCGCKFSVNSKNAIAADGKLLIATNPITCPHCQRSIEAEAKILPKGSDISPEAAEKWSLSDYYKPRKILNANIIEDEEKKKLRCPKCGATNIQFVKKGFDLGGAVLGGILAGGAGLVAGGLGSNDVMCICSNCGHKWEK